MKQLIGVLLAASAFGQSQHVYTAVPSGGVVGEYRMRELNANGTNYIAHKASNSLASTASYTWPVPSAGCISVDGSGVVSIVTCGGVAPFIDSTAIIKDNSDATKLLRIEASGITTATTRVWTAQDADITVAGINIAQSWSASQTFGIINIGTILGTGFSVNGVGDTVVRDLSVTGTCTGCGSSGLPVVDTTGLAKGSSDATKIARLEVDGITTGTTRVLTVPNYDLTIAATNVNNNFTTQQSFAGGAYIDVSGGSSFTSLAISATTRIDSGGNANFASMQIGGSTLINSSREWANFNLVPAADNSLSLGTTSKRFFEGYFSSSVKAYTGGVARGELATGGLTIRSSGGSTLATIESAGGQANLGSILIGGNSFVDASRNVTVNSVTWPGSAATVNSSGNALFGTLGGTTVTASSTLTFGSSSSLVQGSTTRIDGSGNGSFAALTATGNLTWSGQTRGPYTADTGLSFASSAGKIAYYDTSGNFKGWIPVLP